MNILKRIAPPAISAVALIGLATALVRAVPASALPHTVANKTYDVWVVSSFAAPGAAPFHDCYRFSATQACIDGCSGACGRFAEVPVVAGATTTIWHAQNSCNGLALVFTGTSFDGTTGVSTMGGEGEGHSEATNFGITGAENSACTIAPTALALNPYKRAAQ